MRSASTFRMLAASVVLTACGGAAPAAPESASAPAATVEPPADPDTAGAPEPEIVGTEGGGGPGDSFGTSTQKYEPGAQSPSGSTPPPPPTSKPPRKVPGEKAGPTVSGLADDKDDARPLAAVAEAAGERISRDALAGVVDANLERFRPCATGDAKVELRLTLSGGGSVTKAEAVRSQPDDARLRDCVVDVLRGLSFPRGAGSDTSTVSFQLVLSKPAF